MDEALHAQHEIRPAREQDVGLIADILAEAFAGDPVMNWTFAGGGRAFRTTFFELARGLYLKRGFGHIAGDAAATLWLPAGETTQTPLMTDIRIALAAVKAAGLSVIGRALNIQSVMARAHPGKPHYYLFAVGVREAMKGKGLGGRILREGLKRADAAGALAYLENSNPKNTPLYERLGFRATAHLPLPQTAPPLLGMLRERQGETV